MTDLRTLPDDIRANALTMLGETGETPVGYSCITEPVPGDPRRIRPARWMIVSNRGRYEFGLDGLCYRATVIHSFDKEG